MLLLLGLVFTIWWYIVSYLGVHLYSSFSRFTGNYVRCCVQFEDVFGEASDRRNKYFYIL